MPIRPAHPWRQKRVGRGQPPARQYLCRPFNSLPCPQVSSGMVRHLLEKRSELHPFRHLRACALCTRPRKASGDGVVQRALSCAYQSLHEQRASVRGHEARGRRGGHCAVCRCERREEC